MTKSEIGKAGEDFCARKFEKSGYDIVGRNYHSRYGEIDVIAQNDRSLVFIEVKTRKLSSLTSGAESVDEAKQKKCALTALDYLSRNPSDLQIRFDVFEILHDGKRLVSFRLIENAFGFDDLKLKNIFY